MTKNQFATFTAVLGTALLLTSCNAPASNPRKQGSYAATRRMRTGSNIPQPDNVDGTNSAMSTTDMERAGGTQGRMSMGSLGGSGSR